MNPPQLWLSMFMIGSLMMLTSAVTTKLETVWAINAGGPNHIGEQGIRYSADVDITQSGEKSDFGKSLGGIKGAMFKDAPLYETERYHIDSFGYRIPIQEFGHYAIIFKFAEVWFQYPQEKIFHISMNGFNIIELDIIQECGNRGSACDVVVGFALSENGLVLDEVEFDDEINNVNLPWDGTLNVDFLKTDYDNPKVCAIAVVRGHISDIVRNARILELKHKVPVSNVDNESIYDDDDKEEEFEDDEEWDDENEWIAPPRAVLDPYKNQSNSLFITIICTGLAGVLIIAIYFIKR